MLQDDVVYGAASATFSVAAPCWCQAAGRLHCSADCISYSCCFCCCCCCCSGQWRHVHYATPRPLLMSTDFSYRPLHVRVGAAAARVVDVSIANINILLRVQIKRSFNRKTKRSASNSCKSMSTVLSF